MGAQVWVSGLGLQETLRFPAQKLAQRKRKAVVMEQHVPKWESLHTDGIASEPKRRRKWTAETDALLRAAVMQLGEERWTLIAGLVPGRTGKQCRERWRNHLSPEATTRGLAPPRRGSVFASLLPSSSKISLGGGDNASGQGTAPAAPLAVASSTAESATAAPATAAPERPTCTVLETPFGSDDWLEARQEQWSAMAAARKQRAELPLNEGDKVEVCFVRQGVEAWRLGTVVRVVDKRAHTAAIDFNKSAHFAWRRTVDLKALKWRRSGALPPIEPLFFALDVAPGRKDQPVVAPWSKRAAAPEPEPPVVPLFPGDSALLKRPVAEEQARNPVAAAAGSCKKPVVKTATHVAEAPPSRLVRLSLTSTSLGGGTVMATVEPMVVPDNDSFFVMTKVHGDLNFACSFPGCGKRYRSRDAVRKHCRLRHLDWVLPQLQRTGFAALSSSSSSSSLVRLRLQGVTHATITSGTTIAAAARSSTTAAAIAAAAEQEEKAEAESAEAAAVAAARNDCGECVNCQDKPKFGGPGIKRQGCLALRDAAKRVKPRSLTVSAIGTPVAQRRNEALAAQAAAEFLARSPAADGEKRAQAQRGSSTDAMVAEVEGLRLYLSSAATGYMGVSYSGEEALPYAATTTSRGTHLLGRFATAIEAAVAYARYRNSLPRGGTGGSVTASAKAAMSKAASAKAGSERGEANPYGLRHLTEYLTQQGVDPKVLAGWSARRLERTSSACPSDLYYRYYSPDGQSFRSRCAIADFLLNIETPVPDHQEEEDDDDEDDNDDDDDNGDDDDKGVREDSEEEEEVVMVDEDEDEDEASVQVMELDSSQVAVEGESDAESEDEPPAPLTAAAEPLSAEEANALVGRRIRVWWEGDRKWFRGRIQSYNALWQTHLVLYDDNDRRSYRLHEGLRWELEGTAGVEVMEEWEQLELRCAISFLPLTDPARGSSCAHLSRCNFDMLWQHVSRHHACPMAGCEAPMRRTRDVVRDDALRAKLEALPDGTQTVWRRGHEIRSTQPQPAHASAPQSQPQPQSQRRPARSSGASASTAPVPSSRVAGGKERVVVVKKERR